MGAVCGCHRQRLSSGAFLCAAHSDRQPVSRARKVYGMRDPHHLYNRRSAALGVPAIRCEGVIALGVPRDLGTEHAEIGIADRAYRVCIGDLRLKISLHRGTRHSSSHGQRHVYYRYSLSLRLRTGRREFSAELFLLNPVLVGQVDGETMESEGEDHRLTSQDFGARSRAIIYQMGREPAQPRFRFPLTLLISPSR